MSARDDGGPAFPDLAEHTGMSLRDWFAGMAMQGLIANPDPTNARTAAEAAKCAFYLADAMLAERAK